VDQLVELERVDLAGVRPGETLSHPLKQRPELLLVGVTIELGATRQALSERPRSPATCTHVGFYAPTDRRHAWST
jgi:hypothetical protein